MQQHLRQKQAMMSGYIPSNVTSDHIQQYLDENKSLILKIVESQNSGELSECVENQARLQRNLMYLAAIADSQPQPPSLQRQFSTDSLVQSGATTTSQQQQGYGMLYSQQPYATLQHYQQQQEAALQGHVLLRPADGTGGFPDFSHNLNIGSSRGAGGNNGSDE